MTDNFWQSARIHLRAFEPEDAETFFQWDLDSERARFLDFVWPPSSLLGIKAWLEEQAKKKLVNDTFAWLIQTNAGVPVGTIASHDCNPHNGTFSYGIDIAKEHRGNGYAGEAIRLVLRYYFEELRYQKVTVQVHRDNPASLRLHEKLGFVREGTLRRMVYTHGQYVDACYLGLTVEEFQAQENGGISRL